METGITVHAAPIQGLRVVMRDGRCIGHAHRHISKGRGKFRNGAWLFRAGDDQFKPAARGKLIEITRAIYDWPALDAILREHGI